MTPPTNIDSKVKIISILSSNLCASVKLAPPRGLKPLLKELEKIQD